MKATDKNIIQYNNHKRLASASKGNRQTIIFCSNDKPDFHLVDMITVRPKTGVISEDCFILQKQLNDKLESLTRQGFQVMRRKKYIPKC